MTDDDTTPALPEPLLAIPAIGEPVEAAGQPERPIADGTLPAPDLHDSTRTGAGHPRDDADRTRGEIVAESIAQHADHVIGARFGPAHGARRARARARRRPHQGERRGRSGRDAARRGAPARADDAHRAPVGADGRRRRSARALLRRRYRRGAVRLRRLPRARALSLDATPRCCARAHRRCRRSSSRC